jgi:hypothetical protein
MSCKKTRKLIDLYLDGEASAHQKELLFSHAQTCEECNLRLNESRKFHNVIASVSDVRHPSHLHRSVMSRIQTEEHRKIRPFAFPIIAWASIAMVIVMIFSVLWIKNTTVKPEVASPKPEIYIVSPKEDSVVDNQYVDISAVLNYGKVNSVRVILDGKDVTDATEISKDFLIYTSDALKDGYHKVVIHAADEKGESTVQRSWEFYVIPLERASIPKSSRLS